MRIIRHYACVEVPPATLPPLSHMCVCVGMHVIVLTISIHKSVCGMQIYCILCRQAAAFSFWRCRCCCCCCCSASVWSVPALLWFSLSFLRFSLFVSFCFGLVWFSFCLQLKRVFDWDLHLPLACVCVCVWGVSLKMFLGIGIWVPRFPHCPSVYCVGASSVLLGASECLLVISIAFVVPAQWSCRGLHIYRAVKSVRDSEIMQCLTEREKWAKTYQE